MRHDAGSRGGTKASAIVFALAFLLAHAAALRWVPDAAAASFAFLIAAPLLAGLACAVRARRSGPRAEWNALALAMLLWGAGMAACMYQEEFRANSDGTPALGMLLFPAVRGAAHPPAGRAGARRAQRANGRWSAGGRAGRVVRGAYVLVRQLVRGRCRRRGPAAPDVRHRKRLPAAVRLAALARRAGMGRGATCSGFCRCSRWCTPRSRPT